MKKEPVSVVLIAKNEEKRIDECLKSVHGWADEIIVVDDESTDNTVEIAKKYTDIVFVRKMENEGKHRNWAYAQAKNKWILSIDADESLTDELKDEIDQTLPGANENAFNIPRRNYIGDIWVKHGGQYPSAQLRVFKQGCFRYEEVEVHPRAFVDGKRGTFKGDIIHKSYRDFNNFVAKLNSQTDLEAKKWFKSDLKLTRGKAFWRTVDRFFRAYIGKKGYKDGFIGFMFAFFASLYQVITYAKYWEMQQKELKKKNGKKSINE